MSRFLAEAIDRQPRSTAPWPDHRGRELDWIRDVLGRKTRTGKLGYHAAGRAMVRAHFEHRRIHVRAGRKASKSFTLSDTCLAAFYTRPMIGLVIAPTWRQVKEQLFANMMQARADSATHLPGHWGQTKITLGPKHYLLGISTNQPDRAHGYHTGAIVPDDPDSDVSDQETLELVLTGTCRKEDVRSDNTVLSTQLYDLHLVKKHTGDVRRATRKGLLGRILETIFSF